MGNLGKSHFESGRQAAKKKKNTFEKDFEQRGNAVRDVTRLVKRTQARNQGFERIRVGHSKILRGGFLTP